MQNIRKKVSLCIPMTHTIPADWFVNLIDFLQYNLNKVTIEIHAIAWYLTAEARNDCIRRVLNQKEQPDYVFFLDADNMPAPDTLMHLIHANKDIVTALYFEKKPPHYPVVRMKDPKTGMLYIPTELPANELVPIDAAGAGCLLIKTHVLKKMKEPWFAVIEDETHTIIGEDIYFFLKAKEAGFQAYVDTSCVCPHWGGVINEKHWLMFHDRGLYIKNKMHKPEIRYASDCKDCKLIDALLETLDEYPDVQLKAYDKFLHKTRFAPKQQKAQGGD